MAATAVICAIVLLCAGKVHGYYKGGGIQAVDGIYDGRFVPDSIGIGVQAVFNQGGVTGNVLFVQEKPGGPVLIHIGLMGLDQFNDDYRWRIHEFPVRTSLTRDFPCEEAKIGAVYCPALPGANCTGDLTETNGPLHFDRTWQTFEDPNLRLTGPDSIIGRSLVIDRRDGPEGAFICSNIEQLGASREILRATFDNPEIQGDVIFRYATGRDDVIIEADIHRINPGVNDVNLNEQGNIWSLHYGPCDDLGEVFGASTYKPSLFTCEQSNQRECILGDLSGKCGNLDFVDGRARELCTDNQLGSAPRDYLFSENDPENPLVAVIRNANMEVLGCTPIEMVEPLQGRAQFRSLSLFGDFLFWQNGPDDRTFVRAHLTGLRGMNYALRIFENQVEMTHPCDLTELGSVVTKQGGEFILPGDIGAIGNLDGLLVLEDGQQSLRTTVSSGALPLFGPHTILDQTLAIINEETRVVEACGTIMRQEEYPKGEFASLLAYQDLNNPPIPEVVIPPPTP